MKCIKYVCCDWWNNSLWVSGRTDHQANGALDPKRTQLSNSLANDQSCTFWFMASQCKKSNLEMFFPWTSPCWPKGQRSEQLSKDIEILYFYLLLLFALPLLIRSCLHSYLQMPDASTSVYKSQLVDIHTTREPKKYRMYYNKCAWIRHIVRLHAIGVRAFSSKLPGGTKMSYQE